MTVDVINSAIIRVRIVHRFITITITIASTITITTTITVPITITINIRKKPEFGVHAQESYKNNYFFKNTHSFKAFVFQRFRLNMLIFYF